MLSLAATSAQARYILPEIIKVFKEDFPKVKLELKFGLRQIREMVLANEVDLAIATDLEGLTKELFYSSLQLVKLLLPTGSPNQKRHKEVYYSAFS
ncbi:MAG: hypothetical protein Ct9H300mP4_16130 [Gammaproteobacteria bacterium]|nr:MAG: hypothetical protein Ct9H300mP4_16130 [Gammaproteobacteria bacterium]